ncbi:hypothetical protein V1478_018050 [Vespula squamosa]|uniref:Uncharacterized protein n=1 Tax=Vespula squamosa TaxID=30214 RepID=A0ABD1ZWF8_VESSQ
MQTICKPDPCCCPPILVPSCPPPCLPTPKIKDPCSKYYEQIGAEMIGNQLIIRMEKDKSKSKKKSDQWDPPCDCDVVEIQRPTSKSGPKILNANNNNRVLFRVQSKNYLGSKDDPTTRSQAVSYELGSCKDGKNNECRTFTFYPSYGYPGSQEVHTDQIVDGNENVCLLRIKKKPDVMEKIKRNVEMELRTPRPPTPPLPIPSKVSVHKAKRSTKAEKKKKKNKKKKSKKVTNGTNKSIDRYAAGGNVFPKGGLPHFDCAKGKRWPFKTARDAARPWQYRNHRCCDIKKVPSRRTYRSHMKKSHSCTSCQVPKKMVQSKVDSMNHAFDTSRCLVNVDEQCKKKDFSEPKPASKLRYLSDYKKHKNAARMYPFTESSMKNKNPAIKKQISEASHTTNDTKSTVVMEFSTVQKIVQLVDNNGDISMAKVTVIPARDIIEKNKIFDLEVRNKFDDDVATVDKVSRSTIH